MKIMLLYIAFSIFSLQAFTQQNLVYFQDYFTNSKETIKSNKIFKEVSYSYYINNEDKLDSSIHKTLYYNEMGDVLEETLFSQTAGTSVVKKFSYLYDQKSRIVKKSRNWEGEILFYEYEYDSSGNEINVYEYNLDTSQLKIETKIYDEKNNLILVKTKINNGSVFISRKIIYNPDGRIFRDETYDENGENKTGYEFEYISNRKKTFMIVNNNKRLLFIEEFNSNKQCISRKYDINSLKNRFIYYPDNTFYAWIDEEKDGNFLQVVHRYFKRP